MAFLSELFWIFIVAGVVSAFSILVIALILLFIKPALNSPAIHFIRAYRKKMAVAALDCGSRWLFVIGKSDEDTGFMRTTEGNLVSVSPNSMKYANSILFGAGEDFRAMTVNPSLVEIIDIAVKKGITPKEIRAAITKIDGAAKPEEKKPEKKKQKKGGKIEA